MSTPPAPVQPGQFVEVLHELARLWRLRRSLAAETDLLDMMDGHAPDQDDLSGPGGLEDVT